MNSTSLNQGAEVSQYDEKPSSKPRLNKKKRIIFSLLGLFLLIVMVMIPTLIVIFRPRQLGPKNWKSVVVDDQSLNQDKLGFEHIYVIVASQERRDYMNTILGY
ncbi:hypothetical protein NEOLI_002043, partial [Neolecta irregularis DAH-3]